jgi:hypothetical protein
LFIGLFKVSARTGQKLLIGVSSVLHSHHLGTIPPRAVEPIEAGHILRTLVVGQFTAQPILNIWEAKI